MAAFQVNISEFQIVKLSVWALRMCGNTKVTNIEFFLALWGHC